MKDIQNSPELSVLIPAYNEQEVINQCHYEVSEVLKGTGCSYEILYVNDGSKDNTWNLLKDIADNDTQVSLINLSRNFGKELAMTAGLEYTRGQAVIILDADLQDPPELIPKMIEYWRQGYDNVYGKRVSREGETWLKKVTASAFYRFMQKISNVEIPQDTGDFRLLSRRTVDSLLKLKESNRFMKGLFAWVGYKKIALEYARDPRAAGQTKFNYWKLWNFALEGITSFTTAPLKLASYLGVFIALLSFIFGVYIIIKTLLFGDPVAGYPSLMTAVMFIGGVQLLFIGILGEYIGRIYEESKARPLYLIETYHRASLENQLPEKPMEIDHES